MKSFLARNWLILALLLSATAAVTVALDNGEQVALRTLYDLYTTQLASLTPPWTVNVADACSGPWGGLTCTDNHVTGITLSNLGLFGQINDAFGEFPYLRQLTLSGNQLRGSIPDFLGNLVNLTALNLAQNNLGLCRANVSMFRDGQFTSGCNVQGQGIDCYGDCCGCASQWTAKGCINNVPVCKACKYPAPITTPPVPAECNSGQWVIQGGFTGSIIAEGVVRIIGDLTVPKGSPLIVKGFHSLLNITGTLDVDYYDVVLALTSDDLERLKRTYKLEKKLPPLYGQWDQDFIKVGNPLPHYHDSSYWLERCGLRRCYRGLNLVRVHPEKRCRMPQYPKLINSWNTWTVRIMHIDRCALPLGLGLGFGIGIPVVVVIVFLFNMM